MNKVKNIVTLLFAAAMTLQTEAAQVSFSGNSLKAVEVTPDKDTGLDKIFVLYNTDGVKVTFTDPQLSGNTLKWYRYANLGGGYAEEIPGIEVSGNQAVLSDVQGDMGYIIEYGDSRRYYFWITGYSSHRLNLKGVDFAENQECESTLLNLDFSGEPIKYFTINGQQRYLDQEINVEYFTLEWDENEKNFIVKEETKVLPYAQANIVITPPVYTATSFLISGDRFLKAWNWSETVESPIFHPNAISVHTEAIQKDDDVQDDDSQAASNVIKSDVTGLGGSAPAEISFMAYVTDGVVHHEWQMARDENFDSVEYRFNEQDLDYTFTEEGTFYLRYIGSNSDGSCEAYSDVYTVSIGASIIKCPNAFSPNASPGVNDEWKVAYRSLNSFKCWIFDRYGTQLFYFDDPAMGWDGKYRGKYVKPGVYYYVIEADGADGKKYKLSGDINIIGYKQGAAGSGQTTEPTE